MIKLARFSLLLFTILFLSACGSVPEVPVVTEVALDAPENSVMVEGTFGNSCDAIGSLRETIDGRHSIVEIKAKRNDGDNCVDQPTEFSATIPLDIDLSFPGTYQITVNNITKPFNVGVDTPADPFFALAEITNVTLAMASPTATEATLTIQGEQPGSCSAPGGVSQNTPVDNRIRVQLFLTPTGEPESCDSTLTPFERTFQLNLVGIPAGTYTIDVNGFELPLTLAEEN